LRLTSVDYEVSPQGFPRVSVYLHLVQPRPHPSEAPHTPKSSWIPSPSPNTILIASDSIGELFRSFCLQRQMKWLTRDVRALDIKT
jgi:hypothetical protein